MIREGIYSPEAPFPCFCSINILCSSHTKPFHFLENVQPGKNPFKKEILLADFIIFMARLVLVDGNAEILLCSKGLNFGKSNIFGL